jgi:uncharacterized protein
LTLYLDTSVFVALLTDDVFTVRADQYLRGSADTVSVSDLGAAEYASVLARRVRTGTITTNQAHSSFATFDAWRARAARQLELDAADVVTAEAWLRGLDPPLRTLDALHIAIAQRTDALLVTFDQRMAAAARALGTPVVVPGSL